MDSDTGAIVPEHRGEHALRPSSKVSTNVARRDISHRSRLAALICLRLEHAAVPDEHQERSQTQKPARKKLIRRDDRDHSQPLRVTVQILFAILNLWIGVQFYLWVRWAESGGRAFEVSRPAGVEGWLPIEGLMQLKYFLITGKVPHVHAAGFFLFTSFLVISFVFRKAFCSWMCPVGTVSEYLWKLGRSIFGRSFQLPRWADIPLRSLKYLVLSFFAYRRNRHVGSFHRRISQQPLCAHRRRAHAQLLPLHWRNGSMGRFRAGNCFDCRAELLVPLSLPVRRVPRTGLPAQSDEDHP